MELPDLTSDTELRQYLRDELSRFGGRRDKMAKRYGISYNTLTTTLIRGHVPKRIVRLLGYDVRERIYRKKQKKNGS